MLLDTSGNIALIILLLLLLLLLLQTCRVLRQLSLTSTR